MTAEGMTEYLTDRAVQNDGIAEDFCVPVEYGTIRNHEGGFAAQLRFQGEGTEVEETSFMQRQRGRSPTPRRRRRQRQERERQRSRQERRH